MSMIQDLESLTNAWHKLVECNAPLQQRLRISAVIELMTAELYEQSQIRFEDHWKKIKDQVDEEKMYPRSNGS